MVAKENAAKRCRLMTELNEERGKYSAGILLSLVLEIEEEVCYMGRSCIADGFDILDNRRAVGLSINKGHNESGPEETNLSTLLPEPAMEAEVC